MKTQNTAQSNVVLLHTYKEERQNEIIDDLSAQAFLFLRDQAAELDLPVKKVLAEHLLGIACVMKSVEGDEEAKRIFDIVQKQIFEAA